MDRLWGVPQRAEYHPEVDTGVHNMMVLDMSARLDAPLAVRFACLTHDLGKGTTPTEILPRHIGHEQRSADLLKKLCNRLRVPNECRELADVVAREHGNIHRSGEFGAAAIVRLLERCDAFRKPQRFEDVLLACECDARGRLGLEERAYPQRERLLQALARRALGGHGGHRGTGARPRAAGRPDRRGDPQGAGARGGPRVARAAGARRLKAMRGTSAGWAGPAGPPAQTSKASAA